VAADSAGEVNESDESNNRAATSLFVASRPTDLRPAPIVLQGNVSQPGDVVRVESAIDEIANGSAGPSHAFFLVDGAKYAIVSLAPIPPGGHVPLNFTWVAEAGSHALAVVADGYDEVAETNESNNIASRGVFVPPPADLGIRIVSVTHEPLRTDAGNAPNPLARHRVLVDVDNHADRAVFACLSLNVTAATRHVVLVTSEGVAGPCASFAPGTTRAEIVWDPLVALGDVTLTARVKGIGVFDPDPSNDASSADDFVIVGGLGGVVLQTPLG
jgi:hypothetical protein